MKSGQLNVKYKINALCRRSADAISLRRVDVTPISHVIPSSESLRPETVQALPCWALHLVQGCKIPNKKRSLSKRKIPITRRKGSFCTCSTFLITMKNIPYRKIDVTDCSSLDHGSGQWLDSPFINKLSPTAKCLSLSSKIHVVFRFSVSNFNTF